MANEMMKNLNDSVVDAKMDLDAMAHAFKFEINERFDELEAEYPPSDKTFEETPTTEELIAYANDTASSAVIGKVRAMYQRVFGRRDP